MFKLFKSPDEKKAAKLEKLEKFKKRVINGLGTIGQSVDGQNLTPLPESEGNPPEGRPHENNLVLHVIGHSEFRCPQIEKELIILRQRLENLEKEKENILALAKVAYYLNRDKTDGSKTTSI